MLGFDLTLWDYLAFLVLFLEIVAFLVAVVFVLSLPRRIAIARRHPKPMPSTLWAGSDLSSIRCDTGAIDV